MSVYPDSIIFEVKINNVWEDISSDVISTSTCSYGISGTSKVDRVADVGDFFFTLRNDSSCLGGIENYYTPGANRKPGWGKGIPFRVRIVYQGESVCKFYGHITSIVIDTLSRQVQVTALDWMDYALNFPLNLFTIDADKDISEVVALIVNGMPVQPLHTDYNEGQETFEAIFDTVKNSTKALSEFNKLTLSELGYIYVKRDPIDGETLTVEGRYTRNFQDQLTKIPKNGDYLLLEDGSGYFLWEDGSRWMLNTTQETTFDSNMQSLGLEYGGNLANKITVKSYPRRIGPSPEVLFSLNSPIPLSPGETKSNLFGSYRDSTSGANQVTGKNMISPVATTDYLFYQNEDGSGTNLTANLSVTATYGAEGIEYSLTNTGPTAGYVTKLQARGTGIFLYDSFSYTTQDDDSINLHGYAELSLDQKYQDSPVSSESIAKVILRQSKDPKLSVQGVNFLANTDDLLMMSFLWMDVGSLVYIKDSKSGIDGYYYIQGISFTVDQGGIIRFSWNVTEALSLTEVFWILGTSKLGQNTILGY